MNRRFLYIFLLSLCFTGCQQEASPKDAELAGPQPKQEQTGSQALTEQAGKLIQPQQTSTAQIELDQLKSALQELIGQVPVDFQEGKSIVEWAPHVFEKLKIRMDQLLPTVVPLEKADRSAYEEKSHVMIQYKATTVYLRHGVKDPQEQIYVEHGGAVYRCKADREQIIALLDWTGKSAK